MKKLLILFGSCTLCVGQLNASVVACMKTVGQSCSGSSIDKSSWQQSCTNYTYVSGSATCAQPFAGQNVGAVSSNVIVGTGSSADSNTACFCRMLYPVISYVYWVKSFSSVNDCWMNCADTCATKSRFDYGGINYFIS